MGFETAENIREEHQAIGLFCRIVSGDPEFQGQYSCFDAIVHRGEKQPLVVEAKCRPGIYTKYPDGLKVSLHKWHSLIAESIRRKSRPIMMVYDKANQMMLYTTVSKEIVDHLVTMRRKYDGIREPAVFVKWSHFHKVAIITGANNVVRQ